MESRPTEAEFELTGGALCLDFANTLADRPAGGLEQLASYADLVRFARQAGALESTEADRLAEEASRRPKQAGGVLRRAIELREAVFRTFAALVSGGRLPAGDLALLNRSLTEALRFLEVAPAGRRYRWRWSEGAARLDRPLWPIARSAAELLVSDDVERVRECASEGCRWLFLDRSRGRRRRWCDMKTCGNRQKARRHYLRRKAAERSRG